MVKNTKTVTPIKATNKKPKPATYIMFVKQLLFWQFANRSKDAPIKLKIKKIVKAARKTNVRL